MDSIRVVRASIDIEFEKIGQREEFFKREFDKLSEIDDDSIGHWLKLAKAKGETRESDQVLLTLVVELHRKVDEMTKLIKNEVPKKELLNTKALIEAVGFEYFIIEKPIFKQNEKYYGRIDMPTFPKREIPLFFIGVDEKTAKIELLHERDLKDWDSYVTARERVIIREMRGLKK